MAWVRTRLCKLQKGCTRLAAASDKVYQLLAHGRWFFVLAGKAPGNIVFECKSHYIDCLIKELGLDNSLGNYTYTPTTLTKEEILEKHRCF
jgi:hypothetical protein